MALGGEAVDRGVGPEDVNVLEGRLRSGCRGGVGCGDLGFGARDATAVFVNEAAVLEVVDYLGADSDAVAAYDTLRVESGELEVSLRPVGEGAGVGACWAGLTVR